MRDFLTMGGYGLYVWPSYALAVAVLVGQALAAWRALRRAERAVAAAPDAPQGTSQGTSQDTP